MNRLSSLIFITAVFVTSINCVAMDSHPASPDGSETESDVVFTVNASLLQQILPNCSITLPQEIKNQFECMYQECGRTFEYADSVNNSKLDALRDFVMHVQDHKKSTEVLEEETAGTHVCPNTGCDRTFLSARGLIRHRRYCGFKPVAAQIKKNKTRKLIRYANEKPFMCQYPGCAKIFTEKGAVKTHMNSHFGLKPYACRYPGCEEAFAASSNRCAHERKKHSGFEVDKYQRPASIASKSWKIIAKYRPL